MKTEDRKVEEAGCAPAHSEVRKKHKTGDARGRPSWRSSFLGILVRNFSVGSSENSPP